MKKTILIFLFFFSTLLSAGEIKIAIITPTTHPSLQEIERGFVETMNREANVSFKTYNAHGNKILMRSMVEEIASQNNDLVYTIGAKATLMTKEVFKKKGLKTPIVFAAVAKPEKVSGSTITGVTEVMDYERELATMLELKPSIKRVLLPYDPSTAAGLEQDKQTVEAILKQLGIELVAIEIFNASELTQKVKPYASQCDVIFVLKDNTIVSGLEALLKIAKRLNIPLFASDLDSFNRGATYAFGVEESCYGSEAALKALKILIEKKSPQEVPVTGVTTFELRGAG